MTRAPLGALAAFAAVVALGGQNGGFLADTWGWVALPLLLATLVALVVAPPRSLGRIELAWLGGLAQLTAWTALSALWAPTAGPPVVEAERTLLFLAAVAAVVVLGARGVPAAVLAASTVLCAWALVDRLTGPGPSRLEGPIGYANGLGLVAVTGILLVAGGARRRPLLLVALLVLVPALVLTYSRGSWVALAAGLLVLAALAAHARTRVLVALGVGALVAAALVLAFARHGSAPGSGNLDRLASLSGNGRDDYWRVAFDELQAHPLLGGGAGTWSRWWLAGRPDANGALDAHSLYLETLAEVGPFGLALLLAALAVPLVRLRRSPACAAVYVAWLVHAALDWDWELPGVTLGALLCATVLVAGTGRRPIRVTAPARAVAVAVAAAACAAAFVLQVGNAALRSAESALNADRTAAAAADARRADRWQPWSTEPELLLGEAALAAGDVETAARRFSGVVRRDPGDADAWYQLALASHGPTREHARKRAISLDPHGPAADLP